MSCCKKTGLFTVKFLTFVECNYYTLFLKECHNHPHYNNISKKRPVTRPKIFTNFRVWGNCVVKVKNCSHLKILIKFDQENKSNFTMDIHCLPFPLVR